MDGRRTSSSVQVTGTIFLVGEIAIVIPAVSTPVDALRRYNGSFANAAAHSKAHLRATRRWRRPNTVLVNEDNHLGDEDKFAGYRKWRWRTASTFWF